MDNLSIEESDFDEELELEKEMEEELRKSDKEMDRYDEFDEDPYMQ